MNTTTPPARWPRYFLALVAASAAAAGGWYLLAPGKPVMGGEAKAVPSVTVEVVRPAKGGIRRECVQPGTLEPFESADLYAKVSGFLAEQSADIGTRVKKGDVLARVSVPEFEKQVAKATAEVKRADARVNQMTAAVVSAEADVRSAAAAVALAQAELKSKASYRAYRQKQRDRIKDLYASQAIDAKLVDEQEDHFEAAAGAELAAGEAVNAAKQKAEAAAAKVEQAKADRAFADAEVAVAKSQLDIATVQLDYAVIRSPYDGVVTRRSFNRGDFVRSADAGGDRVPVYSVERTDLMRLVVQVPDRDVPFVSAGDPATVEIDALPGVVAETHKDGEVVIARSAESEDPRTRTMRTEIDLRNPTGKLRRGMYGRVVVCLQPGAANAVRVPSAALSGKAEGGKASVRVVRDGKVVAVPVRYGADTGMEVEILSGLSADDAVVVRTSGPVDDGTAITVVDAPARSAGH